MHYAVLVVGSDPLAQLEPYWDQAEVEPYVVGTVAEIFEQQRTYLTRAHDALRERGDDRRFPYVEQVLAMTVVEYTEHVREEYYLVDEQGRAWSRVNPLGQWDYWLIGGRWAGALRTLDGRQVDEARLADLDLERTNAPFAVVVNGDLHTCREVSDEVWAEQWKAHLSDLDEETAVTIVDAHG